MKLSAVWPNFPFPGYPDLVVQVSLDIGEESGQFWILRQQTHMSTFCFGLPDFQFLFDPVAPLAQKEEIIGDKCRLISIFSGAPTQRNLCMLNSELKFPLSFPNFLLFSLIVELHMECFSKVCLVIHSVN